MTTDNISTHSLKDITDQEIRIDKFTGTINNDVLYKKVAHRRNDHFLFIFQRDGRSKIMLDFREIELIAGVVICVLPGQIHYAVAVDHNTEAWVITLDTHFINADYRSVFEDHYFLYQPQILQNTEKVSLNSCIELILSVKENRQQLNFIPQVAHSLIDACVGMFASAYYKTETGPTNLSRQHIITKQFKRLLLQRLKTRKSTAGYASALNITPAYLNEVIKSTTGLTVSYWIQQAIIIEAKRLLYATDNTIKEIAYSLGFDDQAYFTRYFSNADGQPPQKFRLNYRK
ncbi:MAG: helix-turn-helix transcriptional regulator [Flavipsychrobacter sp.]|nr:helix-turn-helix transcriptional regulator [Flavipsychrobacter sp.]